jgi:hypothetical protein
MSAVLNDKGRSSFYGKLKGAVITGDEDGIKQWDAGSATSTPSIGPAPGGERRGSPGDPLAEHDHVARRPERSSRVKLAAHCSQTSAKVCPGYGRGC